jgi:hypothetical protein
MSDAIRVAPPAPEEGAVLRGGSRRRRARPGPHRHWILAVPKMLRPYFEFHRAQGQNGVDSRSGILQTPKDLKNSYP